MQSSFTFQFKKQESPLDASVGNYFAFVKQAIHTKVIRTSECKQNMQSSF